MATAVRTDDPRLDLAPIRERLFAEPWSFEFFQAVRLLALLQPARSQVGSETHPSTEAVHFGANPSLKFPPSQIHSLTPRPDGPPRMDVNFMGVVGPLGTLPKYMTELVAQRVRVGDTALREFLNIFNHRLISFFYRAWEKHHFTVGYERDRSDPITRYLLALVGLGSKLLQNRQPFPDHLLVFYAGLFGLASKPAVGLEAAVGDYFDVDVEVEPFVGAWRSLADEDQCFLEQTTESDVLGFGAVVGDEVWDRQSRVRLRIGPLPLERYLDFLPSGSAWPALRAVAKTFCGTQLEFEIQLILQQPDVPACRLGDPEREGPALGWTSWMKSQPNFNRDAVVTVGGQYGN
jgi:type VI secretion system protein ImpH